MAHVAAAAAVTTPQEQQDRHWLYRVTMDRQVNHCNPGVVAAVLVDRRQHVQRLVPVSHFPLQGQVSFMGAEVLASPVRRQPDTWPERTATVETVEQSDRREQSSSELGFDMNAARITEGIVVNLESVTAEWLDENSQDENYVFVTYADDELIGIGWTWDGKAFAPPTIEEVESDV